MGGQKREVFVFTWDLLIFHSFFHSFFHTS
jgi:hypothetical protein